MKKALAVFLLFAVVDAVFAMESNPSGDAVSGYKPCPEEVCKQFNNAVAFVLEQPQIKRSAKNKLKFSGKCECKGNSTPSKPKTS